MIANNFNSYPHFVHATVYLIEGKQADYKIGDKPRNWHDRTFCYLDKEKEYLLQIIDKVLGGSDENK